MNNTENTAESTEVLSFKQGSGCGHIEVHLGDLSQVNVFELFGAIEVAKMQIFDELSADVPPEEVEAQAE